MLDRKTKEKIYYSNDQTKLFKKAYYWYIGCGLLIIFISIIITVLISNTCGYSTSNVVQTPPSIQNDIQNKYSESDILNIINKDERELSEFLKSNHSINEKDERFKAFINKVDDFRLRLSFSESIGLKQTNNYLSQYGKLTYISTEPYSPILCFLSDSGGVVINYEYVINHYSQYLSPTLKEYLSLLKEYQIDFLEAAGVDDVDSYTEVRKKWNKTWQTFISKYPDFIFKQEILKEIEENKQFIKEKNSIFF